MSVNLHEKVNCGLIGGSCDQERQGWCGSQELRGCQVRMCKKAVTKVEEETSKMARPGEITVQPLSLNNKTVYGCVSGTLKIPLIGQISQTHYWAKVVGGRFTEGGPRVLSQKIKSLVRLSQPSASLVW